MMKIGRIFQAEFSRRFARTQPAVSMAQAVVVNLLPEGKSNLQNLFGGLRAGPVGFPWNLREGDAVLAKKDLELSAAGRLQLSGGQVGSFFTCHFEDATQIVAARIRLNDAQSAIFAGYKGGCDASA